ncbi:MAG: PQQ-binding-like beta-propeller repeat protein [Methylococcus sp.]|nr:PQQ-binding-like beta-propeller repeat protein [Methylococcus sp.]
MDIYFDTAQVSAVAANNSGKFAYTPVRVPSSARPGRHEIRVVGQVSGRSALKKFVVNTDWSQSGFDAGHTGFNAFENHISTANVQSLTQQWMYTALGNANTSPVTRDDVVYVGTRPDPRGNGGLLALRADGARLWVASIKQAYVTSAAAVGGGRVYVRSTDGMLYAFRAEDGARIWKKTVTGFIGNPAFMTAPALANNVIYVASQDDANMGKLSAFQAADGRLLWEKTFPGEIYRPTLTAPVVADGIVYALMTDGALYAVDAVRGELLWSALFPRFGTYDLIAADSRVYAVGYDNPHYLPAVGEIYAFYAKDGGLAWSLDEPGNVFSAAAYANGRLFLNTGEGMRAYDAANGSLLWSGAEGGAGKPSIANGVIYAGNGDGSMSAYDASNGMRLWRSATPPACEGSEAAGMPTIVNGTVYLSTDCGDVFAYRTSSGVSN